MFGLQQIPQCYGKRNRLSEDEGYQDLDLNITTSFNRTTVSLEQLDAMKPVEADSYVAYSNDDASPICEMRIVAFVSKKAGVVINRSQFTL